MRRLSLFLACGLFVPEFARGQSAPEDLLPATTQAYFRWDGIEKHRAAYAKTALGRILKGDMGKFFASVEAELQRYVGATQVSEKLLEGVAPDRLKKVLADADEVPKLLSLIGQKGFLVASEYRRLEPVQVQTTLIVPEGGSLLPIIRALAGLGGGEIKEVKVEQTTVMHLPMGAVHFCAWAAQGHAVMTFGPDAPKAAVERSRGKEARLTDHVLFKRVTSLGDVETSSRGFVDLSRLIVLLTSSGKKGGALLTGLGAEGLKSLTFYSAFQGDATRGVVELEGDGKHGINGLFSGKPFRVADIPAIPADVSSWSCSSLNILEAYDFLFRGLEMIALFTTPDQVAEVQRLPKEINDALGIDFRNDLLGGLEDHFVIYSSPSEGPLFLGFTALAKVKDAAKVRKSLETAIKSLGRVSGLDVRVQKRMFRGQELREVVVRQQGFFPVPTYTIYKDWLVVSLFPQAVKGFILRSNGALPSWQPEPRVKAILDKLPERLTGVAVTDPRPGITQLLAAAPVLLGLLKSFSPGSILEVDTFPNAAEVTQHLFPNVSMTTYERNIYRTESIDFVDSLFGVLNLDRSAALYIAAGLAGFF